MHTESSFDAFLAKQLRAESEYLDDNGFSAQVMANLPAEPRVNPLLKQLIFWLPLVAISLLVLQVFPWRDTLRPIYAWWLTSNPAMLLQVAGVVFFALCLAWVVTSLKRTANI